jgi:hypothetical protein
MIYANEVYSWMRAAELSGRFLPDINYMTR